MSGLVFYADTLANWLDQLSIFWDTLQINVDYALYTWASHTGPSGSIVINLARGFINLLGAGQLTLLEFVFSMMGVGFIGFFVFSLAKWVLDLIT